MTREECVHASGEEKLLFADGYDEAIIGVAQRGPSEWFVVYDTDQVLKILQDRDGMSYLDALEFFDFNIVGAWVGPKTPAFVVTQATL